MSFLKTDCQYILVPATGNGKMYVCPTNGFHSFTPESCSGIFLKIFPMKSEQVNLTRKITIRLKQTEYNKLDWEFKKTTKRKLSEYLRYVLLEKPVTVYTRNQSLDEFMNELKLLRNELSAIGNNYNQTNSLRHISEIKFWAILNEKNRREFMEKIAEINFRIAKFSDKWLQE